MITDVAPWINDVLDHLIWSGFQRDADIQRQAKRVAAFAVAFEFWILVFAGLMYALGAPWSALVVMATSVPILGSLLAVKRGVSPTVAGNLICAAGWLALSLLAILNGGSAASVLIWYSTLPVVAVLTAGIASGVVWSVVPVASLATLALAPGLTIANEMPPENRPAFGFCVLAGLIACQFVLAWVRVGVEQRALASLHETNAKLQLARETLASLEEGFGFSMEAWTRLQREKSALERYVRLQFGTEAVRACETDTEVGLPS